MKTVIYDLFETLVTEWGKHKYTNREIASDLGVDEQAFRLESAKLRRGRYLGEIPDSIQAFRIILENLNINRSENLLKQIAEKREECKRKCFDNIDPEIIDLLSALKENGCKIGLISNCSVEEIKGFKDCAIYNYFDAVVLSCDVGLVKPDAKIYEYCSSILNVQPANCFFVGDGGSDELNGAKNAGMNPLRALWFIKHFVKDYDSDTTYPVFLEPNGLKSFIFLH